MNYFTVNPALPHPDTDGEGPLPTLSEAVDFARKVLNNENANMFTRRQAAFDLLLAFENHKDAP
ncbi:hypothetical protein UFOVP393_54 [uncultured Caudovirales phage]|uniref:Uncharacterized protein n=1 Tax=uncultured Caudovirales phage TaxID=2100421 RepID=A0A6J7X1B8_9CAUD|nr:hypothetical protein UFOVP393_54 [uncultured Caudovirales phage]